MLPSQEQETTFLFFLQRKVAGIPGIKLLRSLMNKSPFCECFDNIDFIL